MQPLQVTQLNLPAGMIDFGVGQPSPSLLPLSLLNKAAKEKLSRSADSFLAYGDPPPFPLARYIETDSVLSLGSFSKIMAPSLRLGWIQGGLNLLNQIVGCGLLDSGGGLNPFTSAVVCSAIEMGFQQEQLKMLQDVYHQRKTKLSRALREYLPAEVRFIEPDGGFFIWLEFPKDIDRAKMLSFAHENNTGYVPGIKFSSRNGLNNYARLSFSYFNEPDLEKGVKRLSRVVKKYMESL